MKKIYLTLIISSIFISGKALAQCANATSLLVDLQLDNTSADSSMYHQSVLEYETVAYTADRNGNANGALNTTAGTIFLTNDQAGNFKCQFPFTFSAWVKANALGARNPIFMNEDHGSSYSGAWVNILQTGEVIASIGNGGPPGSASRKSVVTQLPVITAGQWYHIAVVFNSISDMDIYVNGEEEDIAYTGSGASLYYFLVSGTAGKIGSGVNGSGTNAYFNGAIDDLRFWNVALDATRLHALYDSHLDFINVGSISICSNNDEFTDVTAPNEQCDYNWSNGDNDAVNSIYGDVLGDGIHIIYASVYDSRNILYTDSVIVTVSTCTGIDDEPVNPAVAYPNPVKNTLTVEAATPGYFSLSNVLGQQVEVLFIQQKAAMDLSQAIPGMYFLTELNTGKTTKVIKE